MTAPVLPALFTVNADWRDYEQPETDIPGTTPHIGLPSAFVDFIPRVPAGFEAYVENYQVIPPTNSTWQLTVSGLPLSGTFTLTYGGQTTSALPYNATAAQIQTALAALSSIGANNVSVTQIVDANDNVLAGEFSVELIGVFAGLALTGLTANGASLVATPPSVTITTQQAGLLPVNCEQLVTVDNSIGGYFTLSFRNFATAFIPYNATAQQVQAALQALQSIGAGNVAVDGTAGGPWTVIFQGDLAGYEIPLMTAGALQLQGNTPTAVIANTTNGIAPTSAVQLITLNGNPTAGTFTLTYGGQTTTPLSYQATAAQVQAALLALSSIGAGNLTVQANSNGGPFTVTFAGSLAHEAVQLISATSSLTNWLGLATTIAVQMSVNGTSGVNAQQTLTISGAESGTFTMSYNGATTTPLAWNSNATQIQTALQALSTIGSNCTVAGSNGVFVITFTGSLGNQPVYEIATNATNLSTPQPTAGVEMVQPGIVATNCIQTLEINYAVAGETVIGLDTHTTVPLAWDASIDQLELALENMANIGTGNVSVSAGESGGYVIEFINVLGSQPIDQLTATTNLLTAQAPGAGTIVTNVGSAAVGRDTGVPLKPITARIYDGQLQTIDADDDPGVTLVCNDPVLNLSQAGFADLYYDVRFRDVQIAGVVDGLSNFAVKAPVVAGAITLTDPALTRYEYAPMYEWISPYGDNN